MMTTDERIQAYLDGTLPADETAVFEQELTNPEIARMFGEELFLRELMRDMGPEVPAGLIERITSALSVAPGAKETSERLPRLRAALDGAGWMVRGPAMALSGGPGMVGGSQAVTGMRAALGPLAPAQRSAPSKSQPLWRRALSGAAGARGAISGVVGAGEMISGVVEAGEVISEVGAALVPRSRSASKTLWRRAFEWVRR